MNYRTLTKIINFYVRFTPSYTKIGYYARRLTWGRGPALDFQDRTGSLPVHRLASAVQ